MVQRSISVDYLIKGAGAAGMAFADSVLTTRRRRWRSSTVGTDPEDIGTTPTPSSACTSRPASTA